MTHSGGVGREVVVTVPATSANLGPGFDALGLALALRDEVRVRMVDASSPATTVTVDGEGAAALPRDASHLVVRALHATYDRLGLTRPHVDLSCHNRIPQGRGLGSSAAAAVAGVLAGWALAGVASDDEAVLGLAAELDGHPDNAAACLLGGFTIAWAEAGACRAVRLSTSATLRTVVLVPETQLATHTARGLLPDLVAHRDAAATSARAALLVEAMSRSPHLLHAATEDWLHQPYRAPAMPATAALVATLRARGVAAVVSGAGPSVLALGTASDLAPVPDLAPTGWTAMPLDVATVGAEVTVPHG